MPKKIKFKWKIASKHIETSNSNLDKFCRNVKKINSSIDKSFNVIYRMFNVIKKGLEITKRIIKLFERVGISPFDTEPISPFHAVNRAFVRILETLSQFTNVGNLHMLYIHQLHDTFYIPEKGRFNDLTFEELYNILRYHTIYDVNDLERPLFDDNTPVGCIFYCIQATSWGEFLTTVKRLCSLRVWKDLLSPLANCISKQNLDQTIIKRYIPFDTIHNVDLIIPKNSIEKFLKSIIGEDADAKNSSYKLSILFTIYFSDKSSYKIEYDIIKDFNTQEKVIDVKKSLQKTNDQSEDFYSTLKGTFSFGFTNFVKTNLEVPVPAQKAAVINVPKGVPTSTQEVTPIRKIEKIENIENIQIPSDYLKNCIINFPKDSKLIILGKYNNSFRNITIELNDYDFMDGDKFFFGRKIEKSSEEYGLYIDKTLLVEKTSHKYKQILLKPKSTEISRPISQTEKLYNLIFKKNVPKIDTYSIPPDYILVTSLNFLAPLKYLDDLIKSLLATYRSVVKNIVDYIIDAINYIEMLLSNIRQFVNELRNIIDLIFNLFAGFQVPNAYSIYVEDRGIDKMLLQLFNAVNRPPSFERKGFYGGIFLVGSAAVMRYIARMLGLLSTRELEELEKEHYTFYEKYSYEKQDKIIRDWYTDLNKELDNLSKEFNKTLSEIEKDYIEAEDYFRKKFHPYYPAFLKIPKEKKKVEVVEKKEN